MKKFKILFLITIVFLLSGCTATYNLEISDTSFSENLQVNMNQSEYNDFMSNNNNRYANMYFDDENNKGQEGDLLPLPGVEYYDFDSDDDYNSVTFSGEFRPKEFIRSSMIRRGFNSFKIIDNNEDELHIKTSEGFTFLYDGLTSVKVKVTSSYKVMNSNADEVVGDTLIWDINETNASTKQIIIDYSTKGKKDNSSNPSTTPSEETTSTPTDNDPSSIDPVTIILIVSLLAIVGLILVLVLSGKNKYNNRI